MQSWTDLFWKNPGTSVVDLGGQLVVNYGGSYMAAANPDLRWTWGQAGNLLQDYRFGLGLAGVAGAVFGDPTGLGRLGADVAFGSFHSLVSTETVRMAAMRAQQQPAAAQPGGFAPPVATPAAQPGRAAPGLIAEGLDIAAAAFTGTHAAYPGAYR